MLDECRRSDLVCRFGGEEFVILMPEVNLATATKRAEKIRQRYQTELSEFLSTPTTLSVGIAMWDTLLKNLDGFTKAADLAMYQAKENGRNQVVVYNEKFSTELAAELNKELNEELNKELNEEINKDNY